MLIANPELPRGISINAATAIAITAAPMPAHKATGFLRCTGWLTTSVLLGIGTLRSLFVMKLSGAGATFGSIIVGGCAGGGSKGRAVFSAVRRCGGRSAV